MGQMDFHVHALLRAPPPERYVVICVQITPLHFRVNFCSPGCDNNACDVTGLFTKTIPLEGGGK